MNVQWGANTTFVLLILAGFSSSGLHFAEQDGVYRESVTRGIPELSLG